MSESLLSGCTFIRQQLLADPGGISPETRRHLNACKTCQSLYDELISNENRLKKVVDVPVPAGLSDRILLAQSVKERQTSKRTFKQRRLSAIAASLIVGIIVFSVFFKQTHTTLDNIALQHVYDELHHLEDNHQLSLVQLNNVLEPLNVKFRTAAFPINYAGRCAILNQIGAHVVIQGKYAPITLLFMQGESIKQPLRKQDDSFKAVVLPLKNGNLAIIANKKESLETYQKILSEQLIFRT